ncbi:hypothetical protein Tco_0813939, partial [Tanacetum coccineum]
IALLECKISSYRRVLQFLSNSCISTALTKQHSTYYSNFLRELWYTAEVDGATSTISFTLSGFDKPLALTFDDFTSIIGLQYSEAYVSLPPKEMMRSALATLGLVDEKDPSISSIDLIKLSPLRTRYFSSISRVLMMYIVKCLGVPMQSLIPSSREVNVNDSADKSLSRTNVQPVTQPKEKDDKKSKKKKILSFSEPKTFNVVRKKTPMKQVTETQYVEEPVATVDATKGIGKRIDEEVMEESGIKSLGNMSFDEMYEHDLDKGTNERPFDMES